MFCMVAHGLIEQSCGELEGEDYPTYDEAMAETLAWFAEEKWTLEECPDGGFWAVDSASGEKVYACLIKDLAIA